MNKLGQAGAVYIYSIMLGIVLIILGLAIAPSLTESKNIAMNQTNESMDVYGLSCSNSSISNFDKVTCIATDLSTAYIIGFIILLGIAIIGGKILIG